jgi:hypothetical protein
MVLFHEGLSCSINGYPVQAGNEEKNQSSIIILTIRLLILQRLIGNYHIKHPRLIIVISIIYIMYNSPPKSNAFRHLYAKNAFNQQSVLHPGEEAQGEGHTGLLSAAPA